MSATCINSSLAFCGCVCGVLLASRLSPLAASSRLFCTRPQGPMFPINDCFRQVNVFHRQPSSQVPGSRVPDPMGLGRAQRCPCPISPNATNSSAVNLAHLPCLAALCPPTPLAHAPPSPTLSPVHWPLALVDWVQRLVRPLKPST